MSYNNKTAKLENYEGNWYVLAKKKKRRKSKGLAPPYEIRDGVMQYQYTRPDGTKAWMIAEEDDENGNLEVESKKENNPWAICHTTVDKEKDPEKYERCVMNIKNK